MADPISIFLTAKSALVQVINLIDHIAQRREQKRQERTLRRQTEQHFLHQFQYAWAPPDEDAQEVETIRSRCKKLQNVIKTHWQFIAEKGPTNTAQTGHAHIANATLQMAIFAGLPQAPPPTTAIKAVTGCQVTD